MAAVKIKFTISDPILEADKGNYEFWRSTTKKSSADGMTPRRYIDKVLAGEDQSVRPGEKGFVMRARVPMPSNKDYVVRPKWASEYEMEQHKSRGKKDISRYEKHVRAFADKKKHGKAQRAVGISVEGRNMAL